MKMNLENSIIISSLLFSNWQRKHLDLYSEIDESKIKQEKMKHQFLFQYLFIANNESVEKANEWTFETFKDNLKLSLWASRITPNILPCELKNANNQCSLSCPYWNFGCQCTARERKEFIKLQKLYEPKKGDYHI